MADKELDRYKRAVAGANDGLWEFDLVTGEVWVSDRFLEILGYESLVEYELGVEAWMRRVHPDHREMAQQAFQDHVEKNAPYHVQYKIQRKSGEYIWVEIKGKAITDKEGKPVLLSGNMVDTTSQMAEIEKNHNMNRFLEAIIDNIPNMIFVKEAKELRFVKFNREGERLLGMQEKELVGKNDYDFFPKEQAEFFVAKDRRTLEEGNVLDIPSEPIQTPEGERILHTRKVPLPGQDGEEGFLLGISEDITDQVRAREALKKAMDEALKASRTKSEFISVMSHEMRTPLNSIIGLCDAISASSNDISAGELADYIDRVQLAGDSLLRLVNDILDLSQIESGKARIDLKEVGVQEIVRECAYLLSYEAEKKGLELVIDDSSIAQESKYRLDSGKLRQILVNIIGNAIKFTNQGIVSVSCRDMNGTLEIRVSDTGIGIDKEHLPSIFDTFVQVDSSSTRSYRGTGLGLAISRKLSQLLQGDLTVESELGKGSTFTVSIPAEKAKGSPAKGDAAFEEKSEKLPERILLVEDNEDNRFLIRTYFRKSPVKLDFAENGLIGLEKFKKDQFDLVLLDMQMPVMDGRETARQIREFESEQSLHHTPIVALTAQAKEEDRKEALKVGCDEFVSKPVKRSALLRTISNLYQNKRAA